MPYYNYLREITEAKNGHEYELLKTAWEMGIDHVVCIKEQVRFVHLKLRDLAWFYNGWIAVDFKSKSRRSLEWWVEKVNEVSRRYKLYIKLDTTLTHKLRFGRSKWYWRNIFVIKVDKNQHWGRYIISEKNYRP